MHSFEEVVVKDEGRNVIIGIGIGLASTAILKGIVPMFAGVGRPLAKATIKSGLAAYDRGREAWAHFAEVVEDLAVEARSELEGSRNGGGHAPVGAARAEKTNGGA